MSYLKKGVLAAVMLSTVVFTTGCAPIIVGGAALTTANIAADRRTSGRIVTDEVLEKEVMYDLSREKFQNSHITVTAYNGKVLLTGEIASEKDKDTAQRIAKAQPDLRYIQNELAVMPPSSASERLDDVVLATKVRSILLTTKDIPFKQIKVVTERGNVYLLGLVTPLEAQKIAEVTAGISGVKNVVLCFTVESAQEIRDRFADYDVKPVVK